MTDTTDTTTADDTHTITATDPETGDSTTISFPTTVNDWEYDPDARLAATIVWRHPTADGVYVGWEKPGGDTWAAFLKIPGYAPADTEYRVAETPEQALNAATELMQTYSPTDALATDW